jgi:hypothetical protein
VRDRCSGHARSCSYTAPSYCRCAVHPTGCGDTAPTTMRARAVWLDQRLRIHSEHLLPPRGQRPATIRYSATGGACRCPARQHPGCEGAAPTTERAQAVWMRQQHRIQTGPLLHPRAHRPAPTRPCPAPRRCRPRPTGAAPGSVGVARHRPPVARAQAGKTHDTGSAPGLPQASVAAAAPRGPCTLTRLLALRTQPYVVAPDFVDLYCDILTILFYTPAHSRCS